MATSEVVIEPFSKEAYAPFGIPVVEPERQADASEEFNAAWLLPTDIDGRPQWVFQRAFPQPLRVLLMERHHHAAQLFVPLTRRPFIMVAAPPGQAGKLGPWWRRGHSHSSSAQSRRRHRNNPATPRHRPNSLTRHRAESKRV